MPLKSTFKQRSRRSLVNSVTRPIVCPLCFCFLVLFTVLTLKPFFQCLYTDFNNHHHSLPCLIALATMDLHLSRFQVHEIVCVGLSFCNHTVILSSIFSLCVPLLLFPSIFPIVTKCSNSFLILNVSVLFQFLISIIIRAKHSL